MGEQIDGAHAVRRIVWFSCGAASAVAAKLTVEKDPNCLLVYCDTSKNEHPDNHRFRRDVEAWTGKTVLVLRSEKYTAIKEVFTKRKYMSGPKGAPCTVELKKVPRFQFQEADDIHIFGFTADEQRRITRFAKNNHDLTLEWPLADRGITKEDTYQRIRDAGIELPVMYRLGYKNNNCLGCVKATSPSYWNRIRRDFPGVFRRRAAQSRRIGCRLTRVKGQRIFLDELEPDVGLRSPQNESVSCGPECGTA